jgi:hypothetical protein
MLKVTTQKELPNFNSIFKVDKTSPSNLSWNIEIRCGIYNNVLKCWIGKHCDHLSKTTGRYRVEFKQKSYEVSRIVFCIHTGKDYFDKSFIVDHIDGNTLNNNVENLRSVTASGNMQNTAKRKTTENTGVCLHTSNKDFSYWRARWTDLSGKQREKLFSINKLGFDIAKECAILYRQQMIEELNKQGAGYTKRHGT